jgi:hypothetical protein
VPAEARCAVLGAIIELAWDAGKLRAAGIESTLEHLVESGGGFVDREVKERARRALEAMERVVVAEDI